MRCSLYDVFSDEFGQLDFQVLHPSTFARDTGDDHPEASIFRPPLLVVC